MKSFLVPRDDIGEPVGAGQRAEEEVWEQEGQALAAPERGRLELAIRAVRHSDLTPIANSHAAALGIANEVVRHRLAEAGAAVGSVILL